MSRRLTHAHLDSWAKMCPGNNQSGGKSRTAHTRRGNRWLRHALVEAVRAELLLNSTGVTPGWCSGTWGKCLRARLT